MGATSTFATEYQRLQGYMGAASADTTTATRCKEFVNDAYQELCGVGRWKWLWYEGVVNVQGSYATGTVSATKGAAFITGSGTTFTDMSRTNLEVEAGDERYSIAASGGTWSATNLPLSRNTVAAIAAGTSFVLFQRQYALAARMRGVPVFYTSGDRCLLKPVTASEYQLEAAQAVLQGTAEIVTMGPLDSSGNSTIKVWPVPDTGTGYSIYYEGFQEPATLTDDASTFLFDQGMLPVFRHLALSKLWGYRNDPRLAAEIQLYKAALADAKEHYLWDDGVSDQAVLDPFAFGDARTLRETPPRYGTGWED